MNTTSVVASSNLLFCVIFCCDVLFISHLLILLWYKQAICQLLAKVYAQST